jgi:hypothetical protein
MADRSRLKISEKSRRIGLSWADALEATLTAASPASEGGMDCYYIAANKELSEGYINDVANWARSLNLLVESDKAIIKDVDKDILVFRVKFASGHKVMALSSKPTNLRSRKGRVCLDEFAFHEHPKELLKAALAFLIWGGRVAIISTHNGISSTFYELVEAARAGENEWSLHRTTIDDAIAEGLYKRICSVQGNQWSLDLEREWRSQLFRDYGAGADEELMCIPAESTNCLFDMAKVAEASTGAFAAPIDRHYYLLCVDPNFGSIGNDYYALQVWDVTKIPVSLAYEYRDNTHGSEFHRAQTLIAIDAYSPHMIVFERNGGGLAMAERIQSDRPRITVETVNTGRLSKVQNTDRLAQMIEQGEMVFPKNWIGVDEMRKFSRVSREALSGHDDCVMCAAVGMVLVEDVRAKIVNTEWLGRV